jgi:hypothetical protein
VRANRSTDTRATRSAPFAKRLTARPAARTIGDIPSRKARGSRGSLSGQLGCPLGSRPLRAEGASRGNCGTVGSSSCTWRSIQRTAPPGTRHEIPCGFIIAMREWVGKSLLFCHRGIGSRTRESPCGAPQRAALIRQRAADLGHNIGLTYGGYNNVADPAGRTRAFSLKARVRVSSSGATCSILCARMTWSHAPFQG